MLNLPLDGHMYSILYGLTHQAESTGWHLDGPGRRTVQFRTQQEWLVNLYHIQGLKLSKWTTSKNMFIESDITDTDVILVQVKVHCVDYMYFIFVYKIYITKCQNHYEHSQLQKVGSFCSDTWYMDSKADLHTQDLKISLPSWTGVWLRPQRGSPCWERVPPPSDRSRSWCPVYWGWTPHTPPVITNNIPQ